MEFNLSQSEADESIPNLEKTALSYESLVELDDKGQIISFSGIAHPKSLSMGANFFQCARAFKIDGTPLVSLEELLAGDFPIVLKIYDLDHSDESSNYIVDFVDDPGGELKIKLRFTCIESENIALEELQKNLSRAFSIIENAFDAYIETSLEGTILYWSRQAEILLGWSGSEVLGRNVTDFMISEHGKVAAEELLRFKSALDLGRKGKVRRVKAIAKSGRVQSLLTIPWSFGGAKKNVIGVFLREINSSNSKGGSNSRTIDPLTGLATRDLFLEELESVIETANRSHKQIGLICMDLDGFKRINEIKGHEVGDAVLVEAGKRIIAAFKNGEFAARFAGDDFVILLSSSDARADCTRLVKALHRAFLEPFKVDNGEIFLSASAGVALGESQVRDSKTLLAHAAAALANAKRKGRGKINFYNEKIGEELAKTLKIELLLRQAFAKQEFYLQYQPIYRMTENSIVGLEALIRWQNDEMGAVSPMEFIPMAEEIGLIGSIGGWVANEACSNLANLSSDIESTSNKSSGRCSLFLDVNVSPIQLCETGFVKSIKKLLSKYPLAPETLVLEITEGALIADPEESILRLKRLKDLNVKIAIDDFGTGFSSLSYLKRLPVDIIKIDKSFIDGIDSDIRNRKIVGALLELADALSITVIAEGVETLSQAQTLLDLGCEFAQGYYYSRPVDFASIASKI